ncbi:MAG: ABC transporter permease, partial [Nocardioides sp.]|nr:ABC transporter permease [Nocardioides sp.]
MRSVWLGSLRTHARRYVSAALAVVIGVAFVVVTGALTAATQKSLAADLDAPVRWADGVVDRPAPDTALQLMKTGEAWPVAWSSQPLRDKGRVIEPAASVGVVATEKRWQWQRLTSGRFPTGPGEALVDTNTAKSKQVHLGDTLTMGTGDAGSTVTAKVVGLAKSPSAMAQSPAYVTWPDFQHWSDSFSAVAVGVSSRAQLPAGVTAMTVPKWAEQVRADLNNQVDVITIMLVGFAVIALFVSVLVIANTFSILFVQRLRELALLRAVGATRRQVSRSLRWEALLLGVLSSLVGVAAGIGLGLGLIELVGLFYKTVPLTPALPGPQWLAGGFVVGVLVTVVASLLPTRRVLRVSPLAALRPQEAVEVRSGAGRARLASGSGLVVAGIALLALSTANLHGPLGDHATVVLVVGGAAVFIGVLVLGPILVPALVRLLGAALGRVGGASLRLASANAVRNPRRTAATAASLLVGVTLTTAVLTGMASVRNTLGEKLDEQYPVDVAVTSAKPLPGDIVQRASRIQGVDAA